MGKVMKKKLLYIVWVLSILPFFTTTLIAQEASLINPYVTLQYFKNTEGQRILQTTLTYSKNRIEYPLPGMEISFNTGTAKMESIAKVLTDNKGVARFELTSDFKFITEKDGTWAFSSEFKGNDSIAGGTSEITIKDVRLTMNLALVDSIRTISVKAVVIENGKEKPVVGEAVKVYVPRMFSLLPIGELTLNETGEASVEFPADLPGDKEGNVTLIAKFEENAAFGNVEKRETLKWGLTTDYSVPSSHRALWTKTAPKWMIYTLSVLLAGVWGHYLFALISLIRIKLDSKRKAKEEYRI
jgi:hypothetical protein